MTEAKENKSKLSNLDVELLRREFQILSEKAYGKDLVYFDNAATAQKPKIVIEAINDYYNHYNSNIHRGVHYLSQKASQAYDDVREQVKQFIHAGSAKAQSG